MRNSQAGRRGGRSTLLKHGREHYRRISALGNAVPRQPRARYPVRLSLSLTASQGEQLDERAARTGRSKSVLLRLAWDWWMANEGEGLKKGKKKKPASS